MAEVAARIEGEHLGGDDFSGRTFLHFTAVGSTFIDCRFDRSIFKQACFGAGSPQSLYLRCSFDDACITAIAPGNARFEHCSFRDVVFTEFFGNDVEMTDCSFSGSFQKGVLSGRPLDTSRVGRDRNSFDGNDFREMDLLDVAFRAGIDLERQFLPSGPPYVFVRLAEAAVSRARAEVVGWRDLDARRRALAILRGLESDIAGGQRQLLYRPDTSSKGMRQAAEAIADLLARFADREATAADG